MIAARFDPATGGPVTITAQSGQIQSVNYDAVGLYTVFLQPIPNLTSLDQIVALATIITLGSFVISAAPGFTGQVGVIGIKIADLAGAPSDQPFYLHVDLLGL